MEGRFLAMLILIGALTFAAGCFMGAALLFAGINYSGKSKPPEGDGE